MNELAQWMRARAREVEAALRRAVPPASARPTTLHRAMRHSLLGGGKRLRPLICLAACEACGAPPRQALAAACALECLHTYSLIHDDLPCMDDDDWRRGRPTCHVVFGEAMAVLAGDALQALAFELLAAEPRAGELVGELARAAGSRFLCGGQAADLEAEGKKPTSALVRFIHEGKTAAMLAASAVMGGICAGATQQKIDALRRFGRHLGLAFQIIDDILDCTQSSEQLGKSAGKDARDAKATHPTLAGLDASRREARRQTTLALHALQTFGPRAAHLRALAEWMAERDR